MNNNDTKESQMNVLNESQMSVQTFDMNQVFSTPSELLVHGMKIHVHVDTHVYTHT